MNYWKISKFTASSFIGSVGVISALVSILCPSERLVSIWVLNISSVILLWILIFILMLYSELNDENEMLKRKNGRPYEIPFDVKDSGNSQDLLIHENPIFTNHSIVCVLYIEGEYEYPAFIGEIINHQTNGKMQVQLVYFFPSYKNKKLTKNELCNIKIKPNIPAKFIELFIKEADTCKEK